MTITTGFRRAVASGAMVALGAATLPAFAHDFTVGALRIEHPYSVPSPAGATTAAAYLVRIRNTGDLADRLVGVSTPAARQAEIHRSVVDAENIMRMRAVDAVELPARSAVSLRHGGEWHLMLVDLKAPLKEGDRFPITLRFEKAGERTVMVHVQRPRDASPSHGHQH